MDAWIVAKQAEILAINTEVIGMATENTIRQLREESLAYDGAAFQQMATQLYNVQNELLEYIRG